MRGSGRGGGPAMLRPFSQIEVALVAGAVKDAFRDAGTTAHERWVQAWLYAKRLVVGADEEAAILGRRIAEDACAPDGDVAELRDLRARERRAVLPPGLAPRSTPADESAAREDEELREVPASDVLVDRPVDREVAPEGWLRGERSAVGAP